MTTEPILSFLFDTETTGLLDFKAKLEEDHQPHVCQVAAILFNDETGQIVETLDYIVKPDRWTISPDAAAIHGLTDEICEEKGIPMAEILPLFNEMKKKAKRRIGFNLKFDKQMMARAAIHLGVEHESIEFDDFDVMLKSTNICCIPAVGRKGFKWPKLSEAYKHFFGKDFEDAHTALGDVLATKEIYMIIKTPIIEKRDENAFELKKQAPVITNDVKTESAF